MYSDFDIIDIIAALSAVDWESIAEALAYLQAEICAAYNEAAEWLADALSQIEETFEDRAEEQTDEDKPNYLLTICLQPSDSAHTCSIPWYTSGFQ